HLLLVASHRGAASHLGRPARLYGTRHEEETMAANLHVLPDEAASVQTRTDAEGVIVRDLSKTYAGGVEALREVSFAVRPGEAFGLLGPNGAGKTTTIG